MRLAHSTSTRRASSHAGFGKERIPPPNDHDLKLRPAGKGCQEEVYLLVVLRLRRFIAPGVWLTLTLAAPSSGLSQGLPEIAPINPVSSARSGLYFRPFRKP